MAISVVIAEDETMVRRSFCLVLKSCGDIEVIGEAGDGNEAVARTLELEPEVVLMDVGLPILNGIDATKRILELKPDIKVLALSSHGDLARVLEMLRAGARGYIYKVGGPEELRQGIRAAAAGDFFLSPSLEGSLPSDLARRVASPRHSRYGELSAREREIAQLVAEGHSSIQIGERLGINHKTVEVHRRNISGKLGLKGVAALTRWAIREGLTSPKV